MGGWEDKVLHTLVGGWVGGWVGGSFFTCWEGVSSSSIMTVLQSSAAIAALIWETFPEPRHVRELKSNTCIEKVGGWVV